jgi:hypothetical protein
MGVMFSPAHYVCDSCQRVLESDEERYVLRLQACDSEVCDGPGGADDTRGKMDSDRDYLDEIDDLLERGGDLECAPPDDNPQPLVEYHLCDACHERFLRDPLGRRKSPQLDFSKN